MALFLRRKTVSTPAPSGADDPSIDDPEIPRYPPFLKGLPVAAPARIVATQSELIARLQDGLAFPDTRFAALVKPVIARYAAFVHLLPASEAHHHRGAGGLFRHGLEVAFHAAQASQGQIFALDRGPAERRELEPRWRLAAGLAGLCHDGARLWLLAEGLHLVWPAGAEDMIALLAADRVPGIPRDPDTLADILLERGLAVPRQDGDQSQRYWRLAPAPLARDGQTVTLSMLRLASPDLVLAGALPAMVGVLDASEPTALDANEPPASTTEVAEDVVAATTQDAAPSIAPPLEEALPPAPEPSQGRKIIASKESDSRPEGAVAKAKTWLRKQGAGGETLLALADVLKADPGAWHHRIRRTGEQVLVLFPDGLVGFGAPPRERLEGLASHRLLHVNPLAPLRRVAEVDGAHGALLTPETSRHLLALIEPICSLTEPPPMAGEGQEPEPSTSTASSTDRQGPEKPDTDPARELVARIRARDPELPARITETDGWLRIGRETLRAWAKEQGVPAYVLIRTLGHLPGCRVTPDGGLEVHEGS